MGKRVPVIRLRDDFGEWEPTSLNFLDVVSKAHGCKQHFVH